MDRKRNESAVEGNLQELLTFQFVLSSQEDTLSSVGTL